MDSSLTSKTANKMASSLEEHKLRDSFLFHRASCSLLEDSWGSLQLPDSVDLTPIDSLELLDSDLPNFNPSSLSASGLEIGDSEAWTLHSEIKDTIDNDGTCGLTTQSLSLEVPDSSIHNDYEVAKDRPISILEECNHLQSNPSQRCALMQMKEDKKLGFSNSKDACSPAFRNSSNQRSSCIDEKENFLLTKEPIEIRHSSKHASELSFVTRKRHKTNWDSSQTLDKQEQVLVEVSIISAKNNNSPCDWRCPKEGKSKFKPKPRQQILDGWLFEQR